MRVSRILKSCKEFFHRKDGASGIEYAIIAAMVAVVLAGFVGDISKHVKTTFETIKTSLEPPKAE
ncbi:Flp family type IVb pilin [Pseudomonas sp. JQ170]|uniref:Flp family type IVb pilin n=1 Tax=unclassified Pseudomonas TaxID=196821 RepID=UPI002652EC87|nr:MULTISPECIES: Flp family type IVb pilin [unclassified Pseudomonas]MDN7140174.1 Flp family type IVb pilin [Pseudomonas sp. JQ170]WRO76636.1 Flp family type IVb pilin [Pseudomonas sp. 170C]